MKVKIQTSLGDIIVRLYDETPLHRDNFVKLVNGGFFDNTLFHRVIRDFMIQGGDPESKGAPAGKQLGTGGPGYTIPAELNPQLIHKRGALAAARLGDEVNPERESSGSQFYICWGQIYDAGQLKQLERQLQMQAQQTIFQTLAAERREQIMTLRRNRDQAGLQALQEELVALSSEEAKKKGGLSELQRNTYTTLGGVPHLDGQYTVFGEVEQGLDVVEAIQQAETHRGDRPKKDITIIATTIVE